ncbi:MAG: gliding motility lipoprotein GldD [Flavobacteriaceae bacterium]|nr:gliding motility lipoprotein GldD [Flavobacteriaceae bacterium]
MFNYKLTIVLFVLFTVVFTSCKDEAYPKPKAYLKLEYPKAQYNLIKSNCNFEFEKSELATINYKNNCWMELNYEDLKAKIYITYRPVNNNIEEVLKEVEKLTFEHTIKADAINSQSFENTERKVYSKIFFVEGNAASNIQFNITDSSKNVVTGALYFYSKPHYDSILPAVRYIEKDIRHLIETFKWKN